MPGSRVSGGAALLVAAAIAGAASPPAPAKAAASWKVEAASPARPSFLMGLAALPRRRTAALLAERSAGQNRLVVRQSGRSPRVLAISKHTFAGSLGIDGRGRAVVAWRVNGEASTVYVWIADRVRTLSTGAGSASPALAVGADGTVVIAVTRSTHGASAVALYRGSTAGSIGPPVALPSLAGVDTVALSGTSTVLAGLQAVATPPSTSVTWAFTFAAGLAAPFAPPAALEPATGPPGQRSFMRRTTTGIAPGNAAVAATITLHCPPGTGDLAGDCVAPITGTVQVSIWPAGASTASAPITVSSAGFTSDPQFVRSGDRAWVTWLEGSTSVMDTMAAARVTSGGLGHVRREPLPPSSQRLPDVEPPEVAAAHGGAVRWYTLSRARGRSTLSTIVLDRNGRFGSPATVTHAVSVSRTILIEPATGAPDDLLGWTTSGTDFRATRAWVAWPAERARHAP